MDSDTSGERAPMEPVREGGSALTDLLDRLLTKGIIIDLDLVIGIAGIPLIGVSLRAAIAAIETMIVCRATAMPAVARPAKVMMELKSLMKPRMRTTAIRTPVANRLTSRNCRLRRSSWT